LILKSPEEKKKITNAYDTPDSVTRFYQKRTLRYNQLHRTKKSSLKKISVLRLILFLSIPLLYSTLYFNHVEFFYYGVLILPSFFFLLSVSIYQKKKIHLLKIENSIHFLKRELNRKEGKLKSLPSFETWEYKEYVRNHPLSIDLDLCTKQGLFPYLDTTVSEEGWKLFQEQLLQIQNVDVYESQKKIKKIIGIKNYTYNVLRKLELYRFKSSEKIPIHITTASFDFWQGKKILKLIFPFLSIFTPIWLTLSILFSLPFAPFLLLVQLLIFVSYRKQSSSVWSQIKDYSKTISVFQSAWLRVDAKNRNLLNQMLSDLSKLGDASDWIVSPLPHFLLNLLFLWDLWKIKSFEKWMNQFGKTWELTCDNWISLEASLPIAQYSALHPEYFFPNLSRDQSLSSNSIVHPLLPSKTRISNPIPDLDSGNLMIITGSNMSGKTTYLRSIAINLMLAGVGGRVSGENFNLSSFRIHTLIRSQDSLENGISFFYSEVRRLADIIHQSENSNTLSILFLDEILKGTNSKERKIATKEILNALMKKGAIVFLTTHDLEIAEVEGAKLYHFTELEKDGEMVFDYLLREGISTTTNALKILKKEGIPIRDHIEF